MTKRYLNVRKCFALRKIGILFSNQEYADKFVSVLSEKVDYFKKECLPDNMYSIELRSSCLYILVCGRGQNNAIIGCSKLNNFYGCKEIISFDSCVWLHSKDRVEIGNIVEFTNNIINYNYQMKPEFYFYDDCGISSYPTDYEGQDSLLLTCSRYISSAEVLDNLNLKWQKYNNIYHDASAYGVLAYCKANCLKLRIVRFVKGYSGEVEPSVISKLVDYSLFYQLL